MNLLFLGAPGVGKGTQAEKLSQKHGLVHISTGDILRKELKSNTIVGVKAKEFMVKGRLVPDSVVIDIINRHLTDETIKKGFILDGFPRNIPQAEALDAMLKERTLGLEAVIYFTCPQKIIVERISHRRTCSQCNEVFHLKHMPPKQAGVCDRCSGPLIQRPDDNEAVVIDRHMEYEEKTAPLVKFYEARGLLKRISADRPPDAIFADLARSLNLG